MNATALTLNTDLDAALRRHQAEIDELNGSFRTHQVDSLRQAAEQFELVGRIQRSEARLGELASLIADESRVAYGERDDVHALLSAITHQEAFESTLPQEIGGL